MDINKTQQIAGGKEWRMNPFSGKMEEANTDSLNLEEVLRRIEHEKFKKIIEAREKFSGLL
jgi:hypothetical protein